MLRLNNKRKSEKTAVKAVDSGDSRQKELQRGIRIDEFMTFYRIP